MEQKKVAKLDLGNNEQPVEFPVLSGSMGPDVIDIRKLHAKSGLFTYDPAFFLQLAAAPKLLLLTEKKAYYFIGAIRLSSWLSIVILWKCVGC